MSKRDSGNDIGYQPSRTTDGLINPPRGWSNIERSPCGREGHNYLPHVAGGVKYYCTRCGKTTLIF